MLDFAFFAANFGYSRSDYDMLTPAEAALIRRAYEDKIVTETTLLRDAVYNAITNARRKKGKRFRPLWKRKTEKKNTEIMRQRVSEIQEIEKKEEGWIKRIYEASRGKLRRKEAE